MCDGCRGLPSPTRCGTHPRSWTPTKPCKNRTKTRREKWGQLTFTTPAKENNKPGHGTHANAKRSSKQSERKKNHLDRSYGREDTTETVQRVWIWWKYAFCIQK